MPGTFEVYKDKASEFRFRLKSSDGQNILASEGYKAKSSCLNGIAAVKKNASIDARFAKKETAAGKHAFNLRAGNNQVIGVSQSFETVEARDSGIETIKSDAPEAAVNDICDS